MAQIPFVKDVNFTPGLCDRIHPRVRRVIANNPGPFTYTGTGTYIVGEGEVAVIDPGPEDPEHMAALLDALSGERVTHVLITHTHHDHSGMARSFADRVGAPIFGFGAHPAGDPFHGAPALDEGADHRFAPDETIGDGAVIDGAGWRIEALHTPGHISNHLCFALAGEGALFTGDHMMGWSTTVVAPPDGDMTDYMANLERLLARDDAIYFPTHGAPIEKPRRFVRAVKTHRLMRDAQILEQIGKGRTLIKDMVPEMYADIDPRLHPAAALNVFAHLIRLVRMGTVECDGAPNLGSAYRIAG